MFTTPWEFDLPDSAIARHPVEPRDSCKLLVARRGKTEIEHHTFRDIRRFLNPGDLLVLNDTRVLPARLFARLPTGGKVEVFLLDPRPGREPKECLVRPGRKVRGLTPIEFSDGTAGELFREADRFFLRASVPDDQWFAWLDRAGTIPLPPYLGRAAEARDSKDYQTVFAEREGSVAAPTAGLHFTERLLGELEGHGVEIGKLTLHVGYGTFAPLPDRWENHTLHEEAFHVPDTLWEQVDRTRERGGRIIAVGTTVTRALESAHPGGGPGSTRLFIRPGYRFRQVDGLITNFHLPRSSLLLLVGALLGEEPTGNAYETALREGYRFYSYGDAMAILP